MGLHNHALKIFENNRNVYPSYWMLCQKRKSGKYLSPWIKNYWFKINRIVLECAYHSNTPTPCRYCKIRGYHILNWTISPPQYKPWIIPEIGLTIFIIPPNFDFKNWEAVHQNDSIHSLAIAVTYILGSLGDISSWFKI